MAKIHDFQSIRIKLASSDDILSWSSGEVTKPETINYRTQRPEKDGLFCEKIFGPTKDWECYCGKYRKIRYKGIICDKCGVEVTRSSVRRERMGHIKLATSVTHIWFLRGVPSRIGLLLNISLGDAERIVYFASYIITKVDEASKVILLDQLDKEFKSKTKAEKSATNKTKIKSLRDRAKEELRQLKVGRVLSEIEYQELSMKYGEVFQAGTGADSLKKYSDSLNLKEIEKDLIVAVKTTNPILKKKLQKRLRLIRGFIKANLNPSNMFLTVLPILPPDLRPMVQLDGGRYASSDLNDLYRRVINRNNRLKKLIERNAPEVICRNEKRMLQEAVDSLFDNSARKGQMTTASTGQKRLLKSLADMLKGKQGRFRQNLLGKRVDYSGRSVIVVGPNLALSECGLPKKMALELFKPFVINKIIDRGLAHNIRSAGRIIEDEIGDVWEILEEVIQDKFILLNRAPTLHRLGIQAFRPVLIEGMAIQLHPLVCRAFNADFDGDQMAVHLPLSREAQNEAQTRMASYRNLLKPATGSPITTATQDIVLGCFYMTRFKDGAPSEGKFFSSEDEATLAYNLGAVDLRAKIRVKIKKSIGGKENQTIETSVGRVIFNESLPDDFEFVNVELTRKALEEIFSAIIGKYDEEYSKIADIFDKIKKIGFTYATKSGVSWGMDDLKVPADKSQIISTAQMQIDLIKEQFNNGLLSDKERYNRVLGVWYGVMKTIEKRVPEMLDPQGSISLMISSGARGSWSQPVQMAGMKGLVVNPAGRVIELPIKSNFKEGFNVLEYFISTHGARKGTADTALRTASAGYLTRRLVDVSQDVVIKEEDCGDTKGSIIYKEDCMETGQSYASRIASRILMDSLEIDDGGEKKIIEAGTLIDRAMAKKIEASNIDQIRTRSVLSCKARDGICRLCYGLDLGHNKLVEFGEAVGIVAAQAIGEPGTQLTMRTFHTGGVAGLEDITQGLPRVEEIFESRIPKQRAFISEKSGKVDSINDDEGFKIVNIVGKDKDNKKDEKEYKIPANYSLLVKMGDAVVVGQKITEGHLDIKELLRLTDKTTAERYILKEVQKIYSVHGESIHDKHIEVIIRQMFSRVKIKETGDTEFSEGEVVEKPIFNEKNIKIKEEGRKPSTGVQLLLGITKVALSTNSFLSAASFQETARVLINTAVQGRIDSLRGLKENVIIGRLIPAGTGFKQQRVKSKGEEPILAFSTEEESDE